MSIYRDLMNRKPESQAESRAVLQEPTSNEHIQDLHHLFDQLVKEGNAVTISATTSGAGSSDIIINLAQYFSNAFSPTEQRVLVIDGNSLNPCLHHAFGAENAMGLSELFLTKQFDKIVQRGVLPQVDFISNGVGCLYFPDQLMHDQGADLWRCLSVYRYVLVDSPPIFAHPDAIVLSRVFRNTVLVCEYGKTRTDVVKEARRRIEAVGANVIGAVINRYKQSIPAWIYDRI